MGYYICDNPVKDCLELQDKYCKHYKECMVWYVRDDAEMRLVKLGEYRKKGKYADYFEAANLRRQENEKK